MYAAGTQTFGFQDAAGSAQAWELLHDLSHGLQETTNLVWALLKFMT